MLFVMSIRVPHSNNKDPTNAVTTKPPADLTRAPAPFPALTGAVVVDPGPVEMVVVAPVPLDLADEDVEEAEVEAEEEEEKTLM